MGVPRIFEKDINVSVESVIPDFLKNDVEKTGGEENE